MTLGKSSSRIFRISLRGNHSDQMKWFWNWVILTASSPPDFSRKHSKQYATKHKHSAA
jgi:hypothetical protein